MHTPTPAQPAGPRLSRGFTLVELLVVITSLKIVYVYKDTE